MRALFGLVGAFFCAAISPALSDSATGEWLVADKNARIVIHACGHQLRGHISWERVHGLDDQNPDLAKRNRPTLGLPIFIGIVSTGRDSWAGKIYNSDNGKTYAAKVKLLSSNSLRVEGCVLNFLCSGETWIKVNERASDCPTAPLPAKKPDANQDFIAR